MGLFDEYKSSGFAQWNSIGDKVAGQLMKVGKQTFNDGDTKPVLYLQDAEGKEVQVTASPADMLRQLVEKSPDIGDHIEIVFSGTQNVGKPSPMKTFTITITPKTLMGTQAAAAPPPSTPDSPETQAASTDPF